MEYSSSSDFPKMHANFVYNSYSIDGFVGSSSGATKSTTSNSPIQGEIAMSQQFINQ